MLRFAALFLLTFLSPVYAQLTDDARPSLLFSREDIPTLRERIQRPPYDAWWSTVLTRAQNGLPDSAPERTKARLAKTLAFVYLMTDEETWAQQALAIMRDTRFPPRGGDMGQPHNEGELVAHYALACFSLQGPCGHADDSHAPSTSIRKTPRTRRTVSLAPGLAVRH